MTYLVGAETAQHVFRLVGSAAPEPSAYGPFDTLVQVAAAAVATAGALIALVFNSTRWNPMKGGPLEWLSVLGVAVGVLLLGIAPHVVLTTVAIVGVLLALVCGFKYSGKLGMFRYQMETTPDAKGKVRRWYVVKGDTYTEQAERQVNAGVLLDDIVKGAQYKPDNVWTPRSRAKNLHQLELWYLPTVIFGTLALAAAAMYFGSRLCRPGLRERRAHRHWRSLTMGRNVTRQISLFCTVQLATAVGRHRLGLWRVRPS